MKGLCSVEPETDAMKLSTVIGAAVAAVFALCFVLAVAATGERLVWLHTGNRVLGSLNLDHVPELRGLCPKASSWAEVKESRTAGSFTYRCGDGSFFWPLPTKGRSSELRRIWYDQTGAPPEA